MISTNHLRCLPIPGMFSGAPVSRNVLVSCAHAWMADNAVVTIDHFGRGDRYLKVLKRLHVSWDTGKGKPLQPDLMAYLIEPIPDDMPIPLVRAPKMPISAFGFDRYANRCDFDFSLDNQGTIMGRLKKYVKPTQMAAMAHWMPKSRKPIDGFRNLDSGSRVLAEQDNRLLFLATATEAINGPYLPYWLPGIRQTIEKLGGEQPE